MNPETNVHNPLHADLPGEVTICEIRRHPIGIISIYFSAAMMLIVLAVIFFIAAPTFLESFGREIVLTIGTVIYFTMAFFLVVYLFIGTKVYWGNRWVLTSDSVTEFSQTSLFNKMSSQLSLGSLEDVTSEQHGILSHMFNYGVLKVETAGERSNFAFRYCPKPNEHAQKIIHARELFEHGGGYEKGSEQQTQAQAPVIQAPVAPQPPVGPTTPQV